MHCNAGTGKAEIGSQSLLGSQPGQISGPQVPGSVSRNKMECFWETTPELELYMCIYVCACTHMRLCAPEYIYMLPKTVLIEMFLCLRKLGRGEDTEYRSHRLLSLPIWNMCVPTSQRGMWLCTAQKYRAEQQRAWINGWTPTKTKSHPGSQGIPRQKAARTIESNCINTALSPPSSAGTHDTASVDA